MHETVLKTWRFDAMAKKLKGFAWIQPILSIIVMPMGFVLWGLAAVPGIYLFLEVGDATAGCAEWQQLLALGASLGIGAMLWCIANLLMLGILGMLMRPSLEEAKAPVESWLSIRWGFLALFHRLALPSLQWMVPSFIANIYYGMMGCKIGKGAQINSSGVHDCFMVEIGAKTIIGGDAVINGHLFERDGIHLAKVKIGAKVVIGTMAQINPGCVIGDGAVVASRAVLPKFTEVPAGEVWGGIPAKCIRRADGSKPE
jgi:acetyltransferase-like isoleucine patch superfamily enzyme